MSSAGVVSSQQASLKQRLEGPALLRGYIFFWKVNGTFSGIAGNSRSRCSAICDIKALSVNDQ